MNKEKFVEKHAEKFKEMSDRKSVGFETKKYRIDLNQDVHAICENCDIRGLCIGIGAPCQDSVIRITKKEGSNG